MFGPRLSPSLVLLAACVVSACGPPAAPPPPEARLPATDPALPDADLARRTLDLELAREVLTSADVSVRRAAAKRLEARPDLPENAVRVLGLALRDADRWVRESAARALGGQGAAAATEVERLIAALTDDDPYVRWRVAEALGRVGPGAGAARETLTRHADDPDEVEVVRAASVKALERIGGAGAPK